MRQWHGSTRRSSKSSLVFPIDKSLNQTCKKHKIRFLQVSSPVQGVCYSLKRIGGKWRPGNKVTKISCSFEESAQVSEMFDDSTVLYCKCRPSMETNLFAWILIYQKTASSIHLESGQTCGLTPFLSFMKCCW